jgi:hypothetical protein
MQCGRYWLTFQKNLLPPSFVKICRTAWCNIWVESHSHFLPFLYPARRSVFRHIGSSDLCTYITSFYTDRKVRKRVRWELDISFISQITILPCLCSYRWEYNQEVLLCYVLPSLCASRLLLRHPYLCYCLLPVGTALVTAVEAWYLLNGPRAGLWA